MLARLPSCRPAFYAGNDLAKPEKARSVSLSSPNTAVLSFGVRDRMLRLKSPMSISLEEVAEGRRIAALVVKHCGDKSRPLFDRFDREYLQRMTQAERIDACLMSQAPNLGVRRRKRKTPPG